MFKKYYIASKLRFTVFLTILVIIITLSLTALFNGSYASGSSKGDIVYYAITVEAGDTLWNIASQYAGKDTDIRKLIYEISKINNLDSVELAIGQQLLIPA